MVQPTLETQRLILRPFRQEDIPAIVELLQDPAIARMTLYVPFPYTEEDARTWLAAQEQSRQKGTGYTFAIVRREDGALIGAIDIRPNARHKKAGVGYWIGKPYWNQGYATEALRAIIRYGFETLGLKRIQADHFVENPASGRVMEKAGMKREGLLRAYTYKDGRFRDHVMYAILREDWEAMT